MKRFILAVALMATSIPAFALLSGTYTINAGAPASATNYQTVNSAITDLSGGTRADGGPVNGPGVIGAVTLRIAAGSGPYNEQVSIPAIIGASAINTIRITGNTTRETITFGATTTTDRQVVKLNGADYIILDSLTLINTGTVYGFGVHLTADADFNTVSNCIITVDSTSASANFCGIAISGATATTTGNNGDDNMITNNMVYGGYYGYSANGTNTTTYSQNNSVVNNEFRGFYYYGIRHYEQNMGVITDNIVHARISGTTAGYGMYIYYNDRFNVSRNTILRAGTYGMYFFYGNYQGGAPTSRATCANNMISGLMVATSPYGIYATTNATQIDFYHNSVSLTAGNGRCMYLLAGSGNNVVNNSFAVANSTTGYALYISATTYVTNVDYNNFYAPGSSNFIFIGAAYTTATYVGGGGYNVNSIDGNPYYLNSVNNLHVQAPQLSNVGTNAGITTDIDGDARPSNGGYDIGADEFTPVDFDASFTAFINPAAMQCNDPATPVEIVITNNGADTIFTMPVTVVVSGYVSATLTVTYNDTLPFAQSDTILMGTVNTLPGGTLTFTGYTALAGEQVIDNDTLISTALFIAYGTSASGSDDTVCVGDSTVLTVNVDGFAHDWYDAPSGGNFVTSGDTFATPALSSTTTYYVESMNSTTGNLTTTFANNNSCGGGNMFDVAPVQDLAIDSFACNMSAGAATVSVYYKAGTYAGSETNPAAWTLLGTANVTSTGTGIPTYVPIGGLTIPAGQTYAIYIYTTTIVYTTLATTTTYSNSDLSITCGVGLCSQFGGTNNPRGWNGTVYYTVSGCPNPVRTPITVYTMAPPVVTLGADTASCVMPVTIDAGNPGSMYTWSNGDTTQQTTISTTGTYYVSVSNMYCPSASDTINVTIHAAPVLAVSAADDSICEGMSDTLMVSGASTYNWSSGGTAATEVVTPAMSMMYTVTGVDSNGCSSMDSVMVVVNTLPTVGHTASANAICITDSVTLNGTGAAMYAWSGGVSDGVAFAPTASGTYTVTGTDVNGCMNMDSASVIVNALPVVGHTASDTVICMNDSITLTGTGASNYAWSGGVVDNIPFAPASSMSYVVTGTDTNGCTGMDSVAIVVNSLPNVTVTLPFDTICLNDAAATLSGGSPIGGTWSGTGVSGNSFTPATAGNGTHAVTYMYTDSAGCSSSAMQNVVVDPCAGIAAYSTDEVFFSVYPNPNNGQFTISLGETQTEMQFVLYNSLGEQVDAFMLTRDQNTYNGGGLSRGVYLLRGEANGMIQSMTVIVH